MIQKQKFRAVIEDAGNGGAFVTIPFDVEDVFGKKRVKVKATIDGELYQGSLGRMGGSCHVLGVLKSIRVKISKSIGDEVEVIVEEDIEPRVIKLPQDMMDVLKDNPESESFFKQLSYTHQKKYVQWIDGAKRKQTRQVRLGKIIELLKQGKRDRTA
ncbi:MAG: YdeI/OmpD-associated family protein [Anaerolineales bacterium]|nr:YdeI/OmpD-associated family protein [Anaerolineales bacterium]